MEEKTKTILRPLARPLLDVSRAMLSAWALRRGWRPPHSAPIEDYIRAPFGYDDEAEVRKVLPLVRNYTMVSFERLATLWLQVQYLDHHNVSGAFVECGVWRGGAVALMALAHLHSVSSAWRQMHLFDSWQGLPEPDADLDGKSAVEYAGGARNGALRSVDRCVASLEETRDLLESKVLYPSSLIHYHAGWFQETVPHTEVGEIALLRLDGDWYESTRICLEHLYTNVVSGGVVVLDDYGLWAGCRRATDEFLVRQPHPIMLHHIDYSGRYFLKP
jgi:O-methyltransferase